MGWYCHPDTMSIAAAQHAAKDKLGKGASWDSIEFKKAYREAYAEQNQGSYQESLDSYLAELDEEIEWLEQGKKLCELEKIRREQFMNQLRKESE